MVGTLSVAGKSERRADKIERHFLHAALRNCGRETLRSGETTTPHNVPIGCPI